MRLYEPTTNVTMVMEDDAEVCHFAWNSGHLNGLFRIMLDKELKMKMIRAGPGANGMIMRSDDVVESVVPYFEYSLVTMPMSSKKEIKRLSPDTRLKKWAGNASRRVSKFNLIYHNTGRSLVWSNATKRDLTIPGCGELLYYEYDVENCWNFPLSPCNDLDVSEYGQDDGHNPFVYDNHSAMHWISNIVIQRLAIWRQNVSDVRSLRFGVVDDINSKSIFRDLSTVVTVAAILPSPQIVNSTVAVVISPVNSTCNDACVMLSATSKNKRYECDNDFPNSMLNDCTFLNDVFNFSPKMKCERMFNGPFIDKTLMLDPFSRGFASRFNHFTRDNSWRVCDHSGGVLRSICVCKSFV